jgi:DnaJ-class molecular chaperone
MGNSQKEIRGKTIMSKWRKDIDEKKQFNPRKYGMVFCPDCKGSGKFDKAFDACQEVCPKCGGFGLLKREIETSGGGQ